MNTLDKVTVEELWEQLVIVENRLRYLEEQASKKLISNNIGLVNSNNRDSFKGDL